MEQIKKYVFDLKKYGDLGYDYYKLIDKYNDVTFKNKKEEKVFLNHLSSLINEDKIDFYDKIFLLNFIIGSIKQKYD
jgi:hypothetical protein